MTEKILLDTDIGFDIDDAVCLAYLLSKPECRLLGITTVTGEPEKRAQMASAMCRAAGQDIPIYPGAAVPLLMESIQTTCPQAEALAGMDYQTHFPTGEAVEFLRSTIRAHPGEITLLTIGPLTNIALLFRADPEIPSLLKGWVGMGGLFKHRVAGLRSHEYNMLLDPHAAAVLYKTPLRVHRSVGIEVTSQVYLSEEEVRQKFHGTLLEMTLRFSEIWFRMFSQGITFHDPLAA
ncbi:MAG: nucleoside hydrolase, partial [Anaerolineaceae bacterium]